MEQLCLQLNDSKKGDYNFVGTFLINARCGLSAKVAHIANKDVLIVDDLPSPGDSWGEYNFVHNKTFKMDPFSGDWKELCGKLRTIGIPVQPNRRPESSPVIYSVVFPDDSIGIPEFQGTCEQLVVGTLLRILPDEQTGLLCSFLVTRSKSDAQAGVDVQNWEALLAMDWDEIAANPIGKQFPLQFFLKGRR